MCVLFFFFFKQKTAYEMRISDWSSDVCSSDLNEAGAECFRGGDRSRHAPAATDSDDLVRVHFRRAAAGAVVGRGRGRTERDRQIGRASWRERVCQYV